MMNDIFLKPNFFALLLLLTFSAVPSLSFAQDASVMQNTEVMEKAITKVKQIYQANPKKGPAAVQALTKSQDAWKETTVKTCKAGAAEKMMDCMNTKILERTQVLNAMATAP